MHVADSSGTMREVTAAWVSDGATWREVIDGYTANSSGALQQWANFGGTVTATVTAVNHLSVRIGWEAVGATSVALKINGATVYTASTATGSYVVAGQTPGSSISVTATATWPSGSKTSAPVMHTLAVMPAPTGVGVSDITATSMVVDWDSVAGATDYQVCNQATGGVLQTTTNLTWTRTGLTAGTQVKMYVKARFSTTVVSVPSATVTATTIATFPAGAYTFKAGSCDTWQTSPTDWRGTSSDELWHGNGYPWSSRGVNTAYFFNYRNNAGTTIQSFFGGGAPVKVTRVEVYVKRNSSSHGINSAQLCRFYQHQHASKPTIPYTTGSAHNNGTLARGEGKWIDLPVAWGTNLVSGSTKGIAWGGTLQDVNGARYMIGPTISALSTMGQVRITCS